LINNIKIIRDPWAITIAATLSIKMTRASQYPRGTP
jgi:hypothetical protein